MMPRTPTLGLCIAALLALYAFPAFGHTGGGALPDGLISGFLHPLTGLDHLVAMVAVGLWGARLGAPAIWVLPITFPLIMALGGLIGISGVELPLPEVVIALSAIVLGAAVSLRVRWPVTAAAALVAAFAIFHGYAHGREMPEAASPEGFAIGFVTATGLLHLAGILIGTLNRLPWGALVVRGLGLGIACLGVVFLFGALSIQG